MICRTLPNPSPEIFPAIKNKRGHHPSVDDGPEKRFGCCCLPAITRRLQKSP